MMQTFLPVFNQFLHKLRALKNTFFEKTIRRLSIDHVLIFSRLIGSKPLRSPNIMLKIQASNVSFHDKKG